MTSKSNKEKIAGKIAGGILSFQEKLSSRMNRLPNLKGWMICFCVISGSLSIYFIVDAVVAKPKTHIKIDRIRAPRPIEENNRWLYDQRIPEEIVQSIRRYKKYMDSTGQSIRPGLADSIRIIEEMYLQKQ